MAIVTALAFAGIMVFSACSNVTTAQLPGGKSEEGKVIVSFSAGRIALSPGKMDFDTYRFTFSKDGGELPAVMKGPADELVFTLPAGSGYTLKVEAYKDEALAAGGTSASFTVSAVPVEVPVKLAGVLTGEGEGTFSYTIKHPEGAEIMELYLFDDEDYSPVMNKTATAPGETSGTVNVNAGWYFVQVQLAYERKVTGYANGVVIYPGQTTEYNMEFAAEDFASVAVNSIAVSPKSLFLHVTDEPSQLKAAVLPEDATNLTVNWSTSDALVATVDNGMVTPVGAGTATITATAADGSGKFDTATVTVYAGDTGLTGLKVNNMAATGVSENSYTAELTNESTATVTFTKDAGATASYKVGEGEAVVIEDSEFTLGGLALGTTEVTITITADNDDTADYKLAITRIQQVTGITLSSSAETLYVNGTHTFTATIEPDPVTNSGITWKSDDISVATVADGVVTAKGYGSTTITATAADGGGAYAVATVTVYTGDAGLTNLKVNGDNAGGASPNYTATVTNNSSAGIAFTKDVHATATWKAGEGGPVTVSGSAFTVNGLEVGKTTITITITADDGIATADYTLAITRIQQVTGITLSEAPEYLYAGGSTYTFTATIAPEIVTNDGITWTSSDATVATVVNGVVTPLKAGPVTITATAADGGGAKATATITVVQDNMTVTFEWDEAGLTLITTAGSLEIGKGEPVGLAGPEGAASYQWYKNGAEISGATERTYTFSTDTSGTYYVTLRVSGKGGDVVKIVVGE